MSNDIEKKLSLLREEYKKNLPSKIDEIKSLADSLQKKITSDDLTLLHRKLHSLHGSSLTYGYQRLGESAAVLENLVYQLKTSNQITELQFNTIYQYIDDFKKLLNLPPVIVTQEVKMGLKVNSRTIYVLDNGNILDDILQKQLIAYGYEVIVFTNREHFIKVIEQSKPAILFINIHMLNDHLQKILHELHSHSPIPFIFMSLSGEFALRLKAVQINGQAFLVKPFFAEEVIRLTEGLLKADSEIYRVMIIDDEKDVAEYYANTLNQANIKTYIINKSYEVDHALHDFKPDLILIDLYMPDCSGTDLAAIIRQQKAYQSVPIIFLSSEEDEFKQLNAMKIGVDDFIKKSSKPEHLILAIKNKASRYKILQSMTVKDNLTGAFNHSFILHQLNIELTDAVRRYNPLSVAIIDLDNLKRINDVYDYLTGDQVLRSLCLMLTSRLRSSDMIGRYSGEKFLIILPNTDIDFAATLINKLREQFISLNFSSNNQLFNMTFSAGVASFPPHTKVDDLVQSTEAALMSAKKNGRNNVQKI